VACDFVAADRSRWGMPEIDWDITAAWLLVALRLEGYLGSVAVAYLTSPCSSRASCLCCVLGDPPFAWARPPL
jgi:enoyl-CoA hydratase/carnithine racemase